MMWDAVGVWDSGVIAPKSAEFLFSLVPEGTTMLSKQNPDGTDGDPILVQWFQDGEDWVWDIYETVAA
jgi:hypothetical protein